MREDSGVLEFRVSLSNEIFGSFTKIRGEKRTETNVLKRLSLQRYGVVEIKKKVT